MSNDQEFCLVPAWYILLWTITEGSAEMTFLTPFRILHNKEFWVDEASLPLTISHTIEERSSPLHKKDMSIVDQNWKSEAEFVPSICTRG